jgi:hypothetical protein
MDDGPGPASEFGSAQPIIYNNGFMPMKVILDYRTIELSDPAPAGGTTGALAALDSNGTKWLVKPYQGNPDRVATELLANAIYRELDILVPEAGLGTWQGPNGEEWITCTYPMLEGEPRRWSKPNALLAEGFVTDALLANWDVIGLEQDNILWQGDVPVRIDQGGTFVFRAQGKPKPYGPEVVELESMLAKQGQARGTMAVTDDLIRRKAQDTISTLTPDRIEALLTEAPFEDPKTKAAIQSNLESRLKHLSRIAQP